MRAWRLRGALAAVAFSVLAVGLWPLEARQDAPPRPAGGAAAVDFNRQIRPLLSDRCFRCHGPDASKRKAKLRLDTREGLFKALDEGMAVVTPKDPARSELIRRTGLAPEDEDVMPPADAHLALTEAEKALLTQWVVEGAAYRGHWSWEPIGMPVVPTTTTSARTPIDAFVARPTRRRGPGAGATSACRGADPTTVTEPHGTAADACRDRRLRG